MSATRKIASYISQTEYDHFPQEAVHLAKRSMLDCLGVALAGSAEPAGSHATTCARDLGGEPVATIIRGNHRTSAPLAAMANGTMAHALDYDDVFATGGGHPTVTIFPVVFALGEMTGASGRTVLEAYLVGFEVGARISQAIEPGHSERGWHATSTVNTLRAAAAAARMFRLTDRECEMALGIAATMSSGLRINIGTMTKPFHAGHAAHNGIIAGMLARQGFTAEGGVLERSPYGFCHIFSGGGEPRIEKLTEDLGSAYQIVSPGIGLKKYPCVAGIHSAIDAVLHILSAHDITPDMVDGVECGVSKMRPQTLRTDHPKTPLEGKFHLSYCMARAMLDRELGMGQFKQEKVDDPQVIALMQRITVAVDPRLVEERAGKNAMIVTFRLKNGEVLSRRVDKARGTSAFPLSDAEVAQKYRQCAGLVLPGDAIERSLSLIMSLEDQPTVHEIAGLVG